MFTFSRFCPEPKIGKVFPRIFRQRFCFGENRKRKIVSKPFKRLIICGAASDPEKSENPPVKNGGKLKATFSLPLLRLLFIPIISICYLYSLIVPSILRISGTQKAKKRPAGTKE
ncbi:MAG: hypothetical protein SOV73_00425 [Candidatus Faecivivens sp.]|nr:hypothetical protein [Candidatus Faecivivens sp.]